MGLGLTGQTGHSAQFHVEEVPRIDLEFVLVTHAVAIAMGETLKHGLVMMTAAQ